MSGIEEESGSHLLPLQSDAELAAVKKSESLRNSAAALAVGNPQTYHRRQSYQLIQGRTRHIID